MFSWEKETKVWIQREFKVRGFILSTLERKRKERENFFSLGFWHGSLTAHLCGCIFMKKAWRVVAFPRPKFSTFSSRENTKWAKSSPILRKIGFYLFLRKENFPQNEHKRALSNFLGLWNEDQDTGNQRMVLIGSQQILFMQVFLWLGNEISKG